MKIAIMAAGGVGGYFGGRLAAAGADVRFLARGDHRAALARDGLRIASPEGDLALATIQVYDDPAAIGPVDIVLFAVKLWDTERAGASCRPLLGDGTVVITLQNGVDSVARLAPILGAAHIVGGVAYISAVIDAPGVIHHNSRFARIVFGTANGTADGAHDGATDRRLAAFAAACNAAVSTTIERDIWQKFVLLVGVSAMTTLTREPMGRVVADPDARALLGDVMGEVVTVARATGIDLAADYADDRLTFACSMPATMKASMLEDLERGNRLELDWLSGEVVRRGRALAIPTPANQAVCAALRLHAGGRAASRPQ